MKGKLYSFVPEANDPPAADAEKDDAEQHNKVHDVPRLSLRKKTRIDLYDPSAVVQPQLAPTRTPNETKATPAKKVTTKVKDPPPPPPKAKPKRGRPRKAVAEIKVVELQSDTKERESLIEAAALGVLSQLKEVTTAIAKVKPPAGTCTHLPTSVTAAEEEERELRREERRIKHENEREDRMHLHAQRQMQMIRDQQALDHKFRMEENASHTNFLLQSVGRYSSNVDQDSGVAEVHRKSPTDQECGKEETKLLTTTKGKAFCVKWLQTNGFASRIPDGVLPDELLELGLRCLGNPKHISIAFNAAGNDVNAKINILVNAFIAEDAEEVVSD